MPLNVMSASNMGIGEAGITAIFGYCVVFVGLVLLMLVLYIMGAVFKSKAKKAEALKAAEKAAAPQKHRQQNRKSRLHRVLPVTSSVLMYRTRRLQ